MAVHFDSKTQFAPKSTIGTSASVHMTGYDLLRNSLHEDIIADFYVVCNGRKIKEELPLENGKTYHIVPRLVGGKGGFGSMLRAIGAQIEKTTSREACRDLSGRRMRDINNEKKLKDWLAKEADREKDREERRAEKRARELNKRHKFEDKVYHQQKEKVAGDLEEALQTGLKKANVKEETGAGPSKKPKMADKAWIGMDLDSDDLDSGSDNEACPGVCDSQTPASHSSDSDSMNDKLRSSDEAAGNDNACSTSTENASSLSNSEENRSSPTLNSESQPSVTTESPVEPSQLSQPESVRKEPEVDPSTPVDLDLFDNSDDLADLGLERLKVALMTRGLKCGGTLTERAERLFSVKGLTDDEIDPSLKAKGKGKKKR